MWGPSPYPSREGYRYYVSFIDTYSQFTWLFFMTNKSKVYANFLKFKAMTELQFNTKLKCLHTDRGKEYLPVCKFLQDHGVLHRFSCPHTHEQNECAERKHCHVCETGLTLLSASSLPHNYWTDAFACAIFVINRLPSQSLKMRSPFNILFNKNPDYSIFRQFGCACYPH